MGGLVSVLDTCDPAVGPCEYMDQVITKETRIKVIGKKQKMDVAGNAMTSALIDIRHIIGLGNNSDTEEKAEEDEDYQDMNNLKNKYLN